MSFYQILQRKKHTKRELTNTVMQKRQKTKFNHYSVRRYKPWKTDECKHLHIDYNRALSKFSKNRSDENRLELNLSSQRFNRMENNLKSCYKKSEGKYVKFNEED